MAERKRGDGRFDPTKMLGHDLKTILALTDIAPVVSIATTTIAGLDGAGNVIQQVVYPERNIPYVVTFRTGHTMFPAPAPPAIILLSNIVGPSAGDMIVQNCIPMDLSSHDEFTTIVTSGETWRAGSTTAGSMLTIITRSLDLVRAASG